MNTERNAFRAVVAVLGLVPVAGGLLGVFGGAQAFAPGAFDVSLDSHVRYLSGLLLGIGLAYWSTLGAPESHSARYGMLTAIVVAGGLARAYGLVLRGPPDLPMTLALGVELVCAPLVFLWQARLARRGYVAAPR